jgi:hypothetical protein
MGWRVHLESPVRSLLNGLCATGLLSRRGLIRAYTALRLVLPQLVRRNRKTDRRGTRTASDTSSVFGIAGRGISLPPMSTILHQRAGSWSKE